MTNNNKYIYNVQTFTNETDISFYLLGVFITDGNVSLQKSHSINKTYYTCELKSADHNWLKNISELIGENLPLKKANNSECLRLRIHNTDIGNWLVKNECVPNKTLKIKFPNVPLKYLADFIRGCWDGDGSLSLIKRSSGHTEPKAQFYSASKEFIYMMQDMLKIHYDITANIYNVKMQDHKMKNGTIISAKNQLYQMSIGGKQCKKFIEQIYYQSHKISMSRKYEKSKEILQKYDLI